MVAQVEADFKLLAERTARIKRPLRALFVLAVQNGRAVVGGQATSADAILRLAGAENVAAAVNGFRPLPDEALVELAPEVVVAMRRSSGSDAHDTTQLLALKGLASTPAAANRRIVTMDGLVSPGLRPARSRRRARAHGQALSRPCRRRRGRNAMTAAVTMGGPGHHAARRVAPAS